MKLSRSFFLRAGLILACAFLLLWSPLGNGYPLLHADSGTYIWSSVIFLVPQDRPIGYGLFIRATSLAPTLWTVVVAQALGTAYLMFRVAESFLPRRPARLWVCFGIVVATIPVTTISAFVGFILADILTAWLWLGTILFFVTRHRFERVLAALAIWIGVWTHNSHIALALAMLLAGAGALLVPKLRERFGGQLLRFGGVLVLALASMIAVNLYLRAEGAPARGTDTIWLNRFQELGVLRETLERNCTQTQWVLCESLDLVRAHDGEWRWFLFGTDSPIQRVGWEKGGSEQRALVLKALECCSQKIAAGSLAESMRQFWLVEMEEYVSPLDESMNAVLAIQKNYPGELATLRAARQQRGEHVWTWLLPVSERAMLAFWLAGLALVGVWAWRRKQYSYLALLAGTFGFVVLNAVVVATFSGAVTRYQARVAWLIPFVVLIVLCGLVAEVDKGKPFPRSRIGI